MSRHRGPPPSGTIGVVPGMPLFVLVGVALMSFFAGTLFTLHSGIGRCVTDGRNLNVNVEELAQKRLMELQASAPDCASPNNDAINKGIKYLKEHSSALPSTLQFPDSTGRYAVGMARTSKLDFFNELDLGVPMDLPKDGDTDVLILYNRQQALPDGFSIAAKKSSIPPMEMKAAVKNCDYLNVLLTDKGNRNQCIAIVPQYESYHLQKWMRMGGREVDNTQPLRFVSRGLQSNGINRFQPPTKKDMVANWEILTTYFAAFDDAMKELKPLVEKVATPHRTVTVMVSNFGQSELLANFVCAAKSRQLDISSILVFATDLETKELAESLGLVAFYDKHNFAEMPSEAAGVYGDKKFTAMMMAKVMCVHMVSSLKYNILFQDVDIVWYKSPLPYFEEKGTSLQEFDMIFQDDGGHTTRYAPYSANSGFYYVRYNARTEFFFNALLLAGDVILGTDSHQQALIALLSEHASLYGLRVKVISREDEHFPGGYQYHMKTGKYMKALFAGQVHPYIFHMSWTENKDNKLRFLQQMGEWYVNEQCVHKPLKEIPELDPNVKNDYESKCCSVEPIIKCHYRDKPSKFPCKGSPNIDPARKPFWK